MEGHNPSRFDVSVIGGAGTKALSLQYPTWSNPRLGSGIIVTHERNTVRTFTRLMVFFYDPYIGGEYHRIARFSFRSPSLLPQISPSLSLMGFMTAANGPWLCQDVRAISGAYW